MKDMKPAAKRKSTRRAQPKRAKTTSRASARRATTKSAKRASRAPSKTAKKAVAPIKRASTNGSALSKLPKPAAVLAQPKRLARARVTIAPIFTPEITVSAHKFRIGESVHLTAGIFARGGAGAVYKVTQLLPSDGDEQQYRIKSANEPHERVAKQSQLEPAL
jgi:hypothetical protein